mmetsp:Transcript_13589/g.25916  ORF Transcript_13589/g.25916 Transcript_13589/m.25916 type:complete len:335 (+) Transcript_13589:100-1104(+)
MLRPPTHRAGGSTTGSCTHSRWTLLSRYAALLLFLMSFSLTLNRAPGICTLRLFIRSLISRFPDRASPSRVLRFAHHQRQVPVLREASLITSCRVERRLQRPVEFRSHGVVEGLYRVYVLCLAQYLEPLDSCLHVGDLILVDLLQERRTLLVARTLQPLDALRSDVQPPCLVNHVNDAQPIQKALLALYGAFPQTVVNSESSIRGAELDEPRRPHLEVPCLVPRHLQPVPEELIGEVLRPMEPQDDVPGEVDRHRLDMREAVEHGDSLLQGATLPPPRRPPRSHNLHVLRPARIVWGYVVLSRVPGGEVSLLPPSVGFSRPCRLFRQISLSEDA